MAEARAEAMTPPAGMTWNRSWFSLARLMQDGEVIGETALNNGMWTGRYLGRQIALPTADPEAAMKQVAEVAARMQ